MDYLINVINTDQSFVSSFKYTTSSDELIFSSILNPVTEDFNIERRNSLRFVDWHPKREYKSLPLILNENEYDQIISSKAIFCRKVDAIESAKLLDMLDKHADAKL